MITNKRNSLIVLLLVFTFICLSAQTSAQELSRILEDKQWYIWYFNDILRSKNRDTMYVYNQEFREKPRNWADEHDDWKYWYEEPGWKTRIIVSDNNKLLSLPRVHYYNITKIDKKKSLFVINILVTDSILEQNKSFDSNMGINWDLINKKTDFTFLFLFDGDYLDIFIDDFDTYFTTFCHFSDSAWEQLENLIYTNICDLSNITWPRRADKNHSIGTTCIVAESLRLRKEENTSSATLQIMQPGTQVQILQLGKKQTIDDISANWVQVQLADGTIGWCFGGYLVEK